MRFTKWKISRNHGNTSYPGSPKVRTRRYKTKLIFTVIVRNIEVAYIISSPLSHLICFASKFSIPGNHNCSGSTSKMHV